MFAQKEERVTEYGDNKYIFNANSLNAVRIEDLRDLVLEAYEESHQYLLQDVNPDDEIYFDPDYMTFDEFFNCFNPADIVNSAEFWDTGMVSWIWGNVLCPNDIDAVTTKDGAIVFNEELITRA